MNLANKITLFRILLIPLMVALFYVLETWGGVAAAGVFALASLSDMLDGYVARKQKTVSSFGKIFDPLADKMLVAAAMVILLDVGGFVPIWGAVCITLIFLREFMMSVIRQLAAIRGTIVAADKLGKLKTAFLNISLIVLFISLPFSKTYIEELWYAGQILFFVSAAITVISLINYFFKNKNFLKNATNIREIRQLNAGHSVAHPEPGTVFAVTEKYPQQKIYNPANEPHATAQPNKEQQPHAKVNLVSNITDGKLTRDIFDSIVQYVIATQIVSLNKIQEKFQIGYLVASDAIDKMEELNYITKLTPTSKRRVLITLEQYKNTKDRQDF